MIRDINPFEPWRPAPRQRVPRNVNPFEPWRPPGYVPRRRRATPGRLPERKRTVLHASARPGRPPWDGPANPKPFFVLLLLAGMVMLWMSSLAYLPSGHGLRVFCTVLSAGAGLITAIVLPRRQRWSTRLKCAAAGMIVATYAWWFVPTSDGPSLWQAHRRVARLEALPAGEITEFTRGKSSRREAAMLFPSLQTRIEEGELAWLGRTVDEVVAQSDDMLEDDPEQATTRLHQATQELERLDHFDVMRDRVLAARRRALMRRLELAQAQAGGIVPEALRDEAKAVGAVAELEGLLRK
jgi:hypothetical protein